MCVCVCTCLCVCVYVCLYVCVCVCVCVRERERERESQRAILSRQDMCMLNDGPQCLHCCTQAYTILIASAYCAA